MLPYAKTVLEFGKGYELETGGLRYLVEAYASILAAWPRKNMLKPRMGVNRASVVNDYGTV